jgi:radical SAM protein with 4Fe4S-binding SPASM domain
MFSKKSINNLDASIKSGKLETGPTDIQILPTPHCNASCVFCPLISKSKGLMEQAPRFNMYDNDLSGGLLDRLADDLYHMGGLKRVTLTGGEPLLYKFLIPLVFQFRSSFKETELSIVTNGILLNMYAQFFANIGLQNLTVSLNAGTQESYAMQNPGAGKTTFHKILDSVATVVAQRNSLKKDNPKTTLSVVLTKHNAQDVEALFDIGRKIGVDAVTFVPLMKIMLGDEEVNRELVVSEDQLSKFKEDVVTYSELALEEGFYLGYAGKPDDDGTINNSGLYKNQPCYSAHSFAAIYPNGDVRPCCHCEPVMGNLTKYSFSEIWNSKKYQSMRERMLNIQNEGIIDGCLCDECGYSYENAEFHRLLHEKNG